ncbi:MAG: HlyD family secretion protein [Pseudomonadales bacterium]
MNNPNSHTLVVKRVILMLLVPLAIVAGALQLWLGAGRHVSTENAYVKSHVANIAPEISGAIEAVLVNEHEHVAPGTVLFRLRADPFQIALAHAEAALAETATQIAADQRDYRRAQAQINQLETAVAYARTQHERQLQLRRRNLGSAEALDTAAFALASAEKQKAVAAEEAATLKARLSGQVDAPVETYPAYQAASAQRAQAALDLARTEVRAPFAGVVVNRPEPGDYAERGITAMSLVGDETVWIEANFKETQLDHLRTGQTAEITVDSYPDRVWTGTVQSLSRATGAEFALLPPQNATGNWVKIVQRVPVRIEFALAADDPPLRTGMSSEVTVDTKHERRLSDLWPW